MGRATHSSASSSIHSSIDSSLSSAASSSMQQQQHIDLSTDLRLGLNISTCQHENSASATSRDESINWPPIKPHFRNTLRRNRPTLFVKVYMEGIAIGRKVDLCIHKDYNGLISTLGNMFKTTIHFPDIDRIHNGKDHLLTYEDDEGDWMMVGDVPWDLFFTTVKKLKISRADKC